MCRVALLGAVLGVTLGVALAGGYPYVTPTKGRIWPTPQMELTEDTYVTIRRSNFEFVIDMNNCTLLQKAVDRYTELILDTKKIARNQLPKTKLFKGYVDIVNVSLAAPCEDFPETHMDEHYEIKVDSPDQPQAAKIISYSIWGIMRGLESFTHLMVPDGDDFRVNSTQTQDFPRFYHRGLLIDTSRHYLPMDQILQTLDLLSINKMNVLHWHIVDSQSFPYQSEAYPDLSAKGAYTENHIYTAEDISTVVSYATERGIRVVPEFDTPGHTQSWGQGQPGLLTSCYTDGKPDGTYGPVDPSNEANYDFLKTLFTEVTSRFPDHYLHLGGDEVSFTCWESNPDVQKFMDDNNIKSEEELESYYITKVIDIVENLPTKNGYFVWQEVFDNQVKIANDTIVEVWKYGGNSTLMQSELNNVTSAGYQALLSSCWYLDGISYGIDWPKYYLCDPQEFEGTDDQKALVIGGEACIWAEYVDKTNLISRTWPRASAVAEKLWSAAEATTDPEEASPRLEEHRCRMLDRGYNVEPLWPSFCESDVVD